MKTDKSTKQGQKSTVGKTAKSLGTKLSPSSTKEGKQAAQSALAGSTLRVSNENSGQENSTDTGNTLPPLGDVDLANDTPYSWAASISKTVELELDKIQGEAEQKQKLLDQGHDIWNTARDHTRSIANGELNRYVEYFLQRCEAGEDYHAHWGAPAWPKQLKPLADMAASQLQKDRRLLGTLSPAEFAIWKMYQPGCYWYFRVILMSCNIPGEDWLGVMRAAQDIAVVAGDKDAIIKSFLP